MRTELAPGDVRTGLTTRAREVGQIRADIDVQVIVDQLWGAAYHRLLIQDEPLTGQFVTALISNRFDGVAADGS